MKRFPLLAAARFLGTFTALALLACGGGSSSTQPETGTLKVVVTIDGVPAQGIGVTANGPGNQSGQLTGSTDASGVVEWVDVEVGTYAVHLDQPLPTGVSFSQTTKTVTVTADGVVAVTFDGTSAPGTIQGTVTIDGQGAEQITVTIDGPATAAALTDASGQYTFTNVPAGTYTVTISDFPSGVSFGATTKTATLSPGGVLTVDFDGTS